MRGTLSGCKAANLDVGVPLNLYMEIIKAQSGRVRKDFI